MTDGAQLLAALAWQIDAGADEAIADEPTDWTAVSARARAAVQARQSPEGTRPGSAGTAPPAPLHSPGAPRPARTGTAPLGAAEAAAEARRLAQAARTLEELEAAVRDFEGCALKFTATSTVFADGVASGPRVMVVGEAPGEEEDRQGKPFVGPAGRLLDLMLGSIGLSRTADTYITNVLPWRPPGNRKPSPAEMEVCLPFLERHIALVRPPVLLLAGGTAASAVLGRSEGITRLRGRWFEHPVTGLPSPVPTLACFHPAYLLRTPSAKREAWKDLLSVKQKILTKDSG
ncbi:MAG TPA: uracil-DNA glycosylase [Azospirillaceae bacterium]|nr:uracil-DNA glycosylase [Azospirillaceae bacterium]